MNLDNTLRPGKPNPLIRLSIAAMLSFSLYAQAATSALDIPAQSLDQAIYSLAKQTGQSIAFSTEMTNTLKAPAVKGNYSIEQALQIMLDGSGLVLQKSAGGYAIVKASDIKAETLPEVVVKDSKDTQSNKDLSDAYAGGQVAKGSHLGVLGNTDIMDAPFNVTAYTSKTINDQQSRSLADVLANDSSVRVNTSGGAFEYFSIRGFNVVAGDVALNGLYGLMPERRTSVDYAERVEVLKGPSALLSGFAPGGSIGGSINVVPKRASDTPITQVAVGMISDSQLTTRTDVGRRFGENGEFGIRFNGSWREGDTPTDGMSKRLGLGALALDYRGERLRLSLDTIVQKDDDNGNASIGVVAANGASPRVPNNRTAIAPNGYSHGNDRTAVLHGEFDITPDVTIYSSYGQHYRDYNSLAGIASGYNNQGNGSVSPVSLNERFKVTSSDIGLRSTFETGWVKHAVTLSATYYQKEQGSRFSFGAPALNSIYDPIALVPPATKAASPGVDTETTLTSQALTDRLSFLDERLLITLGVRNQRVRVESYSPAGVTTSRYNENAVTPMLGVVVKPWQSVSLYANYIEGLKQVLATAINLTNRGQIFPPYKTKQHEVGIKKQWNDHFTTTVSAFQIAQPNELTQNNIFSLDGEQRNRGLEFNMFGEVASNVRLIGGATLMDARVTKATPALEGNRAPGVAKAQVNIATEWDTPFVPGLTLTARSIYTSTQEVNPANTAEIPGWTRWDIGARYLTSISNRPLLLRAAVENVFDKNYWASSYNNNTLTLGAPRTAIISATLDF